MCCRHVDPGSNLGRFSLTCACPLCLVHTHPKTKGEGSPTRAHALITSGTTLTNSRVEAPFGRDDLPAGINVFDAICAACKVGELPGETGSWRSRLSQASTSDWWCRLNRFRPRRTSAPGGWLAPALNFGAAPRPAEFIKPIAQMCSYARVTRRSSTSPSGQ